MPSWTLLKVLAVNVMFFVNVSVGFWLVGLAQGSMWLIDPYWTLLPPLIGHFYLAHPLPSGVSLGVKTDTSDTQPPPARFTAGLCLVWAWAIRLTHSYFRREEWKFGQREDWRYTKMQRDFPRCWPFISFFAVGLAQQPLLCGISWPLGRSWGMLVCVFEFVPPERVSS